MPESLGNEDSAKCCCRDGSGVVGRRKRAEVLPKRAALRPRATKKYESVAQACRASPSCAGQSGVIVSGELGAVGRSHGRAAIISAIISGIFV